MKLPSRSVQVKNFSYSQAVTPLKHKQHVHLITNDHTKNQTQTDRTPRYNDNSQRLPILNQMNSQLLHLSKLESGYNTSQVLSHNTSLWQNIESVDHQFPLDLNRTMSQAQFGIRFNQVHSQSSNLIYQIESIHKAKLQHLFQLFEQTAQLIKDLSTEKIDNLNSYFTQLYQQVQIVIKMLMGKNKRINLQQKQDDGQLVTEDLKTTSDFHKKCESKVINSSRLKEQIREKDLNMKNIELYLVNSKLAREIEMLSLRLKFVESDMDIPIFKQKMEALQAESQQQLDILINDQIIKERTIIKQTQTIFQIKQTLQKQTTEMVSLQTYSDEHDKKYFDIENTYEQMKTKLNQLREVSNMELEDLRGQQIRFDIYKSQDGQSKQKLINLQYKIDRLTIERSKQIDIPDDNDNYLRDELKIKEMKEHFLRDKTFMVSSKESNDKEILRRQKNNLDLNSNLPQNTNSSIKNKQIEIRTDNINEIMLHKYTYARQNFMVFFESQTKTIEIQMRTISTRRIQMTFFGTIRAIMDAKYNEYLFFDNYSHASHFVDFAYSWLSNFQIDKVTRQIIGIDPLQGNSSTQEDVKLSFILDLLNPKVEKLWECTTFSEFLMEQHSGDELYFYLHCRYMIFRGPCCVGIRPTFDVIQYIKIEHAEFVVDLIMKKYDPNNLFEVRKMLRDKAKKKNLNSFNLYVDAYFVLRVLLEFYKIERKNRFILTQETFLEVQSLQPSGKVGVSFKHFRRIFEINFPNATDVEMCFLYRESYMLGSGAVTAETFFTAATESNFFLKSLKLNSLIPLPALDLNDNKIQYNEQNQQYIEFFKIIEAIPKQNMNILKKYAGQFGLEKVFKEMKSLEKLMEQQFQDPSQSKPLIMVAHTIVSNWQRLRNIKIYQHELATHHNTLYREFLSRNSNYVSQFPRYDKLSYKPLETFKVYQSDNVEIIQNDLTKLEQMLNCLHYYDKEEQLLSLEKNGRIRGIQRVYRKRIQKFYNTIGSMLTTKLKSEEQYNLIQKNKA